MILLPAIPLRALPRVIRSAERLDLVLGARVAPEAETGELRQEAEHSVLFELMTLSE